MKVQESFAYVFDGVNVFRVGKLLEQWNHVFFFKPKRMLQEQKTFFQFKKVLRPQKY